MLDSSNVIAGKVRIGAPSTSRPEDLAEGFDGTRLTAVDAAVEAARSDLPGRGWLADLDLVELNLGTTWG